MLLTAFGLAAVLLAGPQRLTNGDIIDMVKAGLGDRTIEAIIATTGEQFDTSVAGLVALKRAGLSDTLIQAMMAADNSHEARGDILRDPIPDEPGIFFVQDGSFEQLGSEVVGKRDFVGNGWVSGTIAGPRSTFRLRTPAVFVIRCGDGVSAKEFALLQLFTKRTRREFRTLAGGAWRGDGPDRMSVPFEARTIRPRTYLVRVVALPKGEYGFVPPRGFFGRSSANLDRILTFGVD